MGWCNKENLSPNSLLSESLDSSLRHFQTLSTSQSSSSLKRKRPPNIQIPYVLNDVNIHAHVDFQAKHDLVSCFGDLGVGFSSVKGKKKFMEDTHKIVTCLDGHPEKGFFGVYDGHGGRKAAEFVAENLHKNVIEVLAIRRGDMSKEDAVKAAYLTTDKEFLDKGVGSGTCCVTVLIEGKEMIVSNLGDCRAVLCKGGVAEPLTKDHRAEREDEQKRIEDKGGYVEIHKGASRVHGILSVSRSIGDAHLKDWVIAEPDTKIFELTPDMDFLVLASDGLWEEVGNQEAIDIVLKFHTQPSNIEEDDDEFPCVNTNSSSPKVKRISLVKQQKVTKLSPSYKKTANDNIFKDISVCDFETENVSPAKMRRVSLFQHKKVKIGSPNQENKRPVSRGLVNACKELVNLAVGRGSLDDITVIIVDLNHFKPKL